MGRKPYVHLGFKVPPCDECASAGRLVEYQIAHPENVEVLGVTPGGRDLEIEIHDRFHSDLHKGEWYRETIELLEFIRSCTSDSLLDEIRKSSGSSIKTADLSIA